MSGPDDELSPLARGYRAAAPWLSAVWQLVGGVAVGLVGGMGVDRWLGSKPWGLMLGAMLGMAAGFYGFVATVVKTTKKKGDKA